MSRTAGLRRDLRTALVAAVVAVLVTSTPSIAAKVKNADKVDGKHAVAAKASAAKRAGKLVATDKAGHLPADLIPTALGRASGSADGTQRRTEHDVAASGELMSGVFGIVDHRLGRRDTT